MSSLREASDSLIEQMKVIASVIIIVVLIGVIASTMLNVIPQNAPLFTAVNKTVYNLYGVVENYAPLAIMIVFIVIIIIAISVAISKLRGITTVAKGTPTPT